MNCEYWRDNWSHAQYRRTFPLKIEQSMNTNYSTYLDPDTQIIIYAPFKKHPYYNNFNYLVSYDTF